MIDPYELHPKDKKRMSETKKSKSVEVQKVKDVVKEQLEKIRKKKTPTWGYSRKHIDRFFYDLIIEIEKRVGEKNDS